MSLSERVMADEPDGFDRFYREVDVPLDNAIFDALAAVGFPYVRPTREEALKRYIASREEVHKEKPSARGEDASALPSENR